jgi:hypothetical protein
MIRDLIITVVALPFLVSLVSILVNSVVEVVKVMRASSPGVVALGCYWEWGGVPSSSLVVTFITLLLQIQNHL